MQQSVSFWETDTLLQCDYAIIGAGFTGLYTAVELLERFPGKRVVILEQGAFSAGASTRNAGFACFGNISEILLDLESSPEEEVYHLMADRFNGLKKIQKTFGENRIDLKFEGSHELFSKHNIPDWERALAYLPKANRFMEEHTGLQDSFRIEDRRDQIPFRHAIGAISNRFEGHLHSGKLYRAAWQKACRSGVEIYGGLKVIEWEESPVGFKIHTDGSAPISCNEILICNNAFAAQLMPELDVAPARGQILLTTPMDHPLKGIYHYDHGYYYWRALGQRILIGGARNKDMGTETTYDRSLNPNIQHELFRFLEQDVLEGKHTLEIDMQWSGIMGFGSSKSPIIRTISPGVHAGVRLGGMGVALSSVIAGRLASLVTD